MSSAADFADPARTFGFFRFVAATCVLANRIAVEGFQVVSLALPLIAAGAWNLLGCAVPWTAVLGRSVAPPCGRRTAPRSSGRLPVGRPPCWHQAP